uniref:Putative_PNPOx domain-containing protein n=1 Tax=Macrostomum lignano TaxID=282301 RepID=A0A1I8FNB4_9PLAT
MRPERLAQQYVDINGDVLVLSIDKRGRPALGCLWPAIGTRQSCPSLSAESGRTALRLPTAGFGSVDGHVLQGKSHLNAVPIINDACSGSSSSVRLVVVARPTNISAMAYWETNQKAADTLITPTEMEMLAEGAIDTEQLMLIGKTAEQNGQQHRVGAYGLEIDCVLVKLRPWIRYHGDGGHRRCQPDLRRCGGSPGRFRGDGSSCSVSVKRAAQASLVKHITERGPAEIEGSLRQATACSVPTGRPRRGRLRRSVWTVCDRCRAGEVRLTVARQPQQQPANESAEPP